MNAKNKKILISLVSILLILDVPLVLYLFNFKNTAFDENFYKKEFQKYNVYGKLQDYDVEKINNDVLNYLKSEKEESIKNDFFIQREKEHLLDVKNLIQKTINFYYFSLILFFILLISLAFLLDQNIKIVKHFGIIFIISGALTFFEAFAFFAAVNMNFSSAFDIFHNTFFQRGTYTFDPSFENIVNLYPEQLFFGIAQRIIFNTLIFSFFLSLAGILFLAAVKYNALKIKKYIKGIKNRR
ncbi:DUF1461 domain-containing protein [Candidatus Woesearchaeota archaeon]|nr:DUF1461 domain-containing protein [Candidatus Woesearchaeota archaeon]